LLRLEASVFQAVGERVPPIEVVFADELGTWSWTTQSNAAGLNGQAGTFTVSGTLAGAFGKGPIVGRPSRRAPRPPGPARI
jgi:hypothetical protein